MHFQCGVASVPAARVLAHKLRCSNEDAHQQCSKVLAVGVWFHLTISGGCICLQQWPGPMWSVDQGSLDNCASLAPSCGGVLD
jgi:hypothetical protein